MKYILIVMVFGAHTGTSIPPNTAVTTQEFEDQAACEVARSVIKKNFAQKDGVNKRIFGYTNCVPKQSVRNVL